MTPADRLARLVQVERVRDARMRGALQVVTEVHEQLQFTPAWSEAFCSLISHNVQVRVARNRATFCSNSSDSFCVKHALGRRCRQ